MQVLFEGVPAPILSVGPNQIRAVVPFEVAATDSGEMQVLSTSAAVAPFEVNVAPVAPAIYTIGPGSLQALMINQNGTLNSPQNPAPQGSIVTIYATGLNNTQPGLATGTIATAAAPLAIAGQIYLCCSGSNAATVPYAGAAPGMVAGLAQVNFQVPPEATAGLASGRNFFSQMAPTVSRCYYYHR